MSKTVGVLADRLLGLIVPARTAHACRCWYIECERPDGSIGQQECCRVPGHLQCGPCRGL